MGVKKMEFGTIITIIGIIVGIIGITYGVNKVIKKNSSNIKNSGNIKNIKNSNVSVRNINIGKNNRIKKGDKDADK